MLSDAKALQQQRVIGTPAHDAADDQSRRGSRKTGKQKHRHDHHLWMSSILEKSAIASSPYKMVNISSQKAIRRPIMRIALTAVGSRKGAYRSRHARRNSSEDS
jgi:hypothetical protein